MTLSQRVKKLLEPHGIRALFFRGRGEHSVIQLESIILTQIEEISVLRSSRRAELEAALCEVAGAADQLEKCCAELDNDSTYCAEYFQALFDSLSKLAKACERMENR